jgi:pyridoxine 4-dehydrogenase
MLEAQIDASLSGTFQLGGDIPVHRLGYGAMRVTGEGVWGPPDDRDEALAVLRRCVDLGTTLIDTAESYGPHVSEELIRDALHPYPDELVIATKGGLDRTGPGEWVANGRPDRLREELEGSLERLGVDRIELWQLHRIDEKVPVETQLETVRTFQEEGKIRHVGLSEVSVDQIELARQHLDVASVQNKYNLVDREWDPVVDYCESEDIAFIPWYPLRVGKLAQSGDGPVAEIARRHEAKPSQVALAWLLARSPVMLPIPGTSSVAHLEENVAAAGLELTDEDVTALDELHRMGA